MVLKKLTKSPKPKFYIGDNLPGKITTKKYKVKVVRPNLYKMSTIELKKWSDKVKRQENRMLGTDNEVSKEYHRVIQFIGDKKIKVITVTPKDIAEIIKKKRHIKKDIAIDSVSLMCDPETFGVSSIGIQYF